MSDTKKTDPFLIKLWNGALHRAAVHDHRFGECDLPQAVDEHLAQLSAGWSRLDGRCRWEFQFTGVRTCCCGLCRPRACGRRERKSARRRTAIGLGEAVKLWRGGEVPDMD